MPITQDQVEAAQNAQHLAAHDANSVVRLVAGPGTGKSTSIEERVCWLLGNGVPPETTYVISFTRATALDLRERVRRYCSNHGQETAGLVSVSTLHSLALRILKAGGLLGMYPVDPTVLDNWELDNIYDQEFSCRTGYTPNRCEQIRRQWEAFWSTGAWDPPNYLPPDPEVTQPERNAFRGFHEPRAQTYACVLPGEIVRQCVECTNAGSVNPLGLLDIRHLIVDEYQDLNPADQEFVNWFTRRGVTTFIAGDDDQSIYSFRFASPAGLQRLPSHYSGLGDHALSACFRCTPSVLDSATTVIETHPLPGRIPKSLESLHLHAEPPALGKVHRWHFGTAAAEARAIAESCRDLVAAGVAPREILLLINDRKALNRDLFAGFESVGVAFEPPNPVGNKDSDEGRLILSLLRIVCDKGRSDYVARRTILGLLPGVGKITCGRIAEAVVEHNLNYGDIMHRPLPSGVFRGRELSSLNRTRAILAEIAPWCSTDQLSERSEQMLAIISSVLGERAVECWENAIEGLPEEMTLEELRDFIWADTDNQKGRALESAYVRIGLSLPEMGFLPPKVRMMTMHGAKGLSACVVFIPGLEEEIFPGPRRRPYPGLILEAARLLYVSISRARAACVLSFADSRIQYGKFSGHSASRFTRCTGGSFLRRATRLTASEVQEIAECCSLVMPPSPVGGRHADDGEGGED